MIKIDIRSDISKYVAKLKSVREDQLPYAIARAVTKTAQLVQRELKAEMPRVFDNPTPWTTNSLYLKPATKRIPVATVWLKDFAPKGNPAAKYLMAEITGGPRKLKPFEKRLSTTGRLPPGMFVVPGSAAPLDRYGNIRAGELERILSAVGSAEIHAGVTANRTPASAKRKGKRLAEYFIGAPGNGRLPLGVWRRYKFALGTAIKPVLVFVKQPQYSARYRFEKISRAVIAANFSQQLAISVNETMRTAR